MNCLTECELELYLRGGGAWRRLAWRKHLRDCEACRRGLDELKRNLELESELKSALKEGRTAGPPS